MASIRTRDRIVVTLTTWHERICNIPAVLDSIRRQTVVPDAIVLNLAFDESIPNEIEQYLENNHIIVNRTEDTKVFKKLIPTLELYPDSCIINIDDDFIYPDNMIQDFMTVHRKHPNSPISGNRTEFKYFNCHCGCASLTKKEFFGSSINLLDSDAIANCPSDDLVYTYLLAKEGRYYIHTKHEYFTNMREINAVAPYSSSLEFPLEKTWEYMETRFGKLKRRPIPVIAIKKLRNFALRHGLWK